MSKKIVIITLALLIVLSVILAGCQTYKNPVFSMADKDAVVESNGGLVVKQGDYIYFVNGYSGYNTTDSKANKFGNVLKGAILRVKEGEDLTNAEVIVPKSVMGKYTNSGFSIYDDFIYYISPSNVENKAGEVMTDVTQFMRTRLDGQETRVIYQSDVESLTYKYTPYGLVYFKEGKLYCKAYDSKHFYADKEGVVLAEDVTAVHFPKSTTYDKTVGSTLADYIFYTKASEDMYDYSNILYVTNASGSFQKVVINKFTYTNDPVTNPSLAFGISLVNSILESDGLTIYYKKTEYVGTSSSGNDKGLFAYKFNENFDFDKTQEIMLSTNTATKIYPLGYTDGAVVYDAEIKIVKASAEPLIFSGITSVTVVSVQNGYIYYYDANNKLFRYKTDGSENVNSIMADVINAEWLAPEFLGDYMYFFNKDQADYLHRIQLSTYDRLDEDSLVMVLLGEMTSADKEALDEEEEKD